MADVANPFSILDIQRLNRSWPLSQGNRPLRWRRSEDDVLSDWATKWAQATITEDEFWQQVIPALEALDVGKPYYKIRSTRDVPDRGAAIGVFPKLKDRQFIGQVVVHDNGFEQRLTAFLLAEAQIIALANPQEGPRHLNELLRQHFKHVLPYQDITPRAIVSAMRRAREA